MRRAIVFAFHFLLFTVPFAFSAATDELFEFNKMILTYACTVVILTLWTIRMIQEKKLLWARTRFDLFLGVFLLSQVVSTLLSIHPHTSIFGYYSRFHGGLLSTLSYLILYFAAVSNIRREELPSLLRTLLVAGTGAALYAFPEHFGISPSCVFISGKWNVECWVQDVQTRVFGTFGQPNWLAAYLITLIPLLVWWLSNRIFSLINTSGVLSWRKNTWQLLWPTLALFLMLFTTLYTGSRSGFGGLGLGLGILAAGNFWNWWRARKPDTIPSYKRRWLLAPIGLILGIGFLALLNGTPFTPSLLEWWQKHSTNIQEAQSTPTLPLNEEGTGNGNSAMETGGTESGEIRQIVWKGAIDVWKRYPFFGSGVETFAYSYYRDRPIEHNYVSEWDFLYNKAHNEFLNTLATTGAFGLGALLLLMGAFVVIAFKTWWESSTGNKNTQLQDSLFSLALLAGYIALAFSNFFGFSTVMVGVLFFLWPALLEIQTQDTAFAEPSVSRVTSKKPQQEELEISLDSKTIASGVALLAGCFLLLWIYGMWDNDKSLARSKQLLALGEGGAAYQELERLTLRAPQQAEYWEQKGQVLAQLSATLAANGQATLAATLTDQTVIALDQASQANPVHVNIWKSRARAYMWLGSYEEKYYHDAIQALEEARELSPTDSKILHNLALLYSTTGDEERAEAAFRRSIELRSTYEQARKSFAEWLTKQGRYSEAIEQYRFINEKLKPNEQPFTEEIRALEASISAQAR